MVITAFSLTGGKGIQLTQLPWIQPASGVDWVSTDTRKCTMASDNLVGVPVSCFP